MQFIADENFPKKSVDFLREQGFIVEYVAGNLSGISDVEILNRAIENGLTILTFDRDFGELIFTSSLRPRGGVIYFRLHRYTPIEPALILIDLITLSNIEFSYRISVVDNAGLRQRQF